MSEEHDAAERELLSQLLADLEWQREHNQGGDPDDPRSSWLRVKVDEILLSGKFPATRLIVRAHYLPDPSITTEVDDRVWVPEPDGGWAMSPSPGVVFGGLLEWVDTEVEVGDRRRR